MKPRYLWFKLSIAFGLILGLLLLVQTVMTYRYVAHSLIRQEAQREAERRVTSIARAARLTGTREVAALTPVLHELVHEAPAQIAWIRIVNIDGKVIAESEKVPGAPVYKQGELGELMANRDQNATERPTPGGTVLLTINPMRFAPPPFQPPPADTGQEGHGFGRGRGRGGRQPPQFAEIAIYLAGVSTNFGPLQENTVVGTTAAFALLGAVIVMAWRFPNYMHGKHMEEELSLARRVQNDLFPAEDSMAARLAFAAKCVPAYQVGGDLYDVFETDDGEVGLVLGDVSGKGLPAALLMGVVQGAVRASSGTGGAINHEQAAERLNHLLCLKTARERFVSLFWCYFDPRRAELRYVNAGHLPPLLVRSGGGGLSHPEVIRLTEGGPVLGLLPGAQYRQATVPIRSGDLLVVFSDGIVEAANTRDEEFGEEGVVRSIERHWKQPPGEICAAILADVKAFLGKELPQDDQTLLVVRLDQVMPDFRVLPAVAAKAPVSL